MNLSQYIDLLRGQGLASKTVDDYRAIVAAAMRWCEHEGLDLATIPAHRVRDYADRLPRNYGTRKVVRTALRRYWLAVGRDDEPQLAIRVPSKPRPGYSGIDPEDAGRLRRGAELVGGRKGLAVLCLMFTGGRPSEVAGFHYDNIRDGMIAWWRPKTQDWLVIPLHPVLADALGDGQGFVFTGNNGRDHVMPKTVGLWCRQVAETVGMDVTPRQLRATAGMMVLEATSDLDAAASFLGHRSTDVTRNHYVRTSERRLARAVESLDY